MTLRQERNRTREQRQPEVAQEDRGMLPVTERVKDHYLAPAPISSELGVNPFPSAVKVTLLSGLLLGALVGVIFGILFWNGTVVFSGTEQLFSAGAVAVAVFWMFIGVALGIAGAGIVTYVIRPSR